MTTDIYLHTNTGYAPADVLLRTSAVTVTTTPTGGGSLPRLLPERRPTPPPPGHGHIHITVELHGEGRLRSTGHLNTTLTGQGRLTRDPDPNLEALLLDLPELLE